MNIFRSKNGKQELVMHNLLVKYATIFTSKLVKRRGGARAAALQGKETFKVQTYSNTIQRKQVKPTLTINFDSYY